QDQQHGVDRISAGRQINIHFLLWIFPIRYIEVLRCRQVNQGIIFYCNGITAEQHPGKEYQILHTLNLPIMDGEWVMANSNKMQNLLYLVSDSSTALIVDR